MVNPINPKPSPNGQRKHGREAMKIDAMPTPRREDLEFPGSMDGYTILKPLKPYKTRISWLKYGELREIHD